MDKFQENESQIISEKFPEAKDFLKERLALSIERRRTRLLDRRSQHDEVRVPSNKSRSFTELESKNSTENPGSETSSAKTAEAQKWKVQECFPKELEIDNSQSQFLCHICFRSTPSEEAKGDLWIQHVARDIAPYICLHESCQSPQTAFNSFEEWLNHMKEESDFGPEVFTCCPLCSCQPKRDDAEVSSPTTDQELLQLHIAGHLQSLALTSLPLPSDSEPRAERSETSITAAQTWLMPPEPKTPFRHQLSPDLRLNQRQIRREFEPTITSLPESFQRKYLPTQKVITRNLTPGQAWRPHDGQNTDNETFDILVAEDNTVNQRIMFKMLQKHHHTVVIVSNGQDAVDAVKQRKYDVILMDVSMPVMAGFEATEKIREYEQYLCLPRTPVIGLTVRMMHQDRERIFQAQMDGFLCKPIQMRDLQDIVLRYGRLGRSAAGDELHQFLTTISGRAGAPSGNFGAKL